LTPDDDHFLTQYMFSVIVRVHVSLLNVCRVVAWRSDNAFYSINEVIIR